jgi:hypothetical protein
MLRLTNNIRLESVPLINATCMPRNVQAANSADVKTEWSEKYGKLMLRMNKLGTPRGVLYAFCLSSCLSFPANSTNSILDPSFVQVYLQEAHYNSLRQEVIMFHQRNSRQPFRRSSLDLLRSKSLQVLVSGLRQANRDFF